jgi:hypothetical protein
MDTQSDLLARVCKLESRLVQTRLLLAISLLGLAGVLCLAAVQGAPASPGNEVRASRFVLLDAEGKEGAVLGFRDGRHGLYPFGRTPEKDVSPLIAVEVQHVEATGGSRTAQEIEWGAIKALSEVQPKNQATITASSVTLYEESVQNPVELRMGTEPCLEFKDRSGFSFVSISHAEKDGVRLDVHNPLGIKGAWEETAKALANKEALDPRISEAYQRALRFSLVVPPFSDPSLALWRDGRPIWSTAR